MNVLLIYANPYNTPPVNPYGLEIIKSHLQSENIRVKIIDPFLHAQPYDYLKNIIKAINPDFIGISIRNIDNALIVLKYRKSYFAESGIDTVSYAKKVKRIYKLAKRCAPDKMIVLGGAGFTACPDAFLKYLNAEFGVIGPGEKIIKKIAVRFLHKKMNIDRNDISYFRNLRGVIWKKRNGQIRKSMPQNFSFINDPGRIKREKSYEYLNKINNVYYPVRTSMGCSLKCSYCIENIHFTRIANRPIEKIMDEIDYLINRYRVKKIHFACSEFNLPDEMHGIKICDEIINRGFHKKMTWSTYMTVTPFSERFAEKLVGSNCGGIEFTVDSFSNKSLKSLNKNYTRKEIEKTLGICSDFGLNIGLSMLFGSPGENDRSIEKSILFMKFHASQNCHINYSCGIRVYPNTYLARNVMKYKYKHLYGYVDKDFLMPVVFSKPYSPLELLRILQSELKDVQYIRLMNSSPENKLNKECISGFNKNFNIGAIAISNANSDKAICYLKRALNYNPKSIKCLLALIKVYQNREDYTKAIYHYGEIINIMADDGRNMFFLANIYNNIGVAYKFLNMNKDANYFFNKALSASPNLKCAKHNLTV